MNLEKEIIFSMKISVRKFEIRVYCIMRDESGLCMQMHRRSKALAAGVEVGDTLLAINGQPCRHWTTDQAMRTINDSLPGNDVTLHLLRCDDDCFKGFAS